MGFGENCQEEWTWAAWLYDVLKPHVEETWSAIRIATP